MIEIDEENLGDKFGKLFNTMKNVREKVSQVLQENVVILTLWIASRGKL